MSIFQYLVESSKNNLDKTAIDIRMSFNNFDKIIRTITYREFLEETVTLACGLKTYGINENQMLLEMLPNLIESREAIYGQNANGTTVYPISPMIPAFKLEKIVEKNSIKNVIMFGAFYDKFNDQLKNEKIEHIFYLDGLESFNPLLKKAVKLKDKEVKFKIPNDPRIVTWETLLNKGKEFRKKHNIRTYKDFNSYYEKNYIAAVVGTSGTTGVPKGACLSDTAINASDFSERIPEPFKPGEVNLDVLIQSISYGIGIMHHTMSGGLNNIVIPELVTDKLPMLLKKFKPENFSGGPIHYENIIKSKEFKN